MKAVIISAMQAEVEHLVTEYDIVVSGIGKINATIATYKTIKKYNPDLIINFGTAGSLRKWSYVPRYIEIKGLVDCKYFIQRDMDARGLGFELGETPYENNIPMTITAPDHSINTINSQLICATGNNFVQSDIDIQADIVDMEAYAIAKTCYLEKIPFVCFKYISDSADDDAPKEFMNNVKKAGKAFTEYLYSL